MFIEVMSDKTVSVAYGGFCSTVRAGIKTRIREEQRIAAMQAGCQILDPAEPTKETPAEPAPAAPLVEGDERTAKIKDVIEAIVVEGRPQHFNAQGYPKTPVVHGKAGFYVKASEIQAIWDETFATEELNASE